MSSATSTEKLRLEPEPAGRPADQSLQPWQFFVLAGLTCATAVTFIVRGQGLTVVILLTILMGATTLVALAVLRTVRPLVTKQDDRTLMIGDRTRAALEREKMLALRAIKELEFDRAMGKVAEEDFQELGARLRARAIRLMRQLDAGAGYRELIEHDLAKRLKAAGTIARKHDAKSRGAEATAPDAPHPAVSPVVSEDTRVCAACSTSNDPDAKFCKQCGSVL